MAVVVFGSLNMDLVAAAPRLPRPGETLTGTGFRSVHGGKGANQAVACARLGAATRMVGRLGADSFGAALRAGLAQEGIDSSGVTDDLGQPSGIAMITVDEAGENTIVVIPGANGAVGASDLALLRVALAGARVLLLQLEIPLEAVVAAATMAHEQGVAVVLDPAPVQSLPPALYPLIDLLTPNEGEAEALVGFPLADDASALAAAHELLGRGVRRVAVKRGGAGVVAGSADAVAVLPAFPVVAVDTVAAGDAFNGGLAAALAEGRSFDEALAWARAAGALAVTRRGAQAAMPPRAELLAFLAAEGREGSG